MMAFRAVAGGSAARARRASATESHARRLRARSRGTEHRVRGQQDGERGREREQRKSLVGEEENRGDEHQMRWRRSTVRSGIHRCSQEKEDDDPRRAGRLLGSRLLGRLYRGHGEGLASGPSSRP